MNKIFLVVGILTFAASVQAGEQTLQVTPQSLNDWAVTGAEKNAVGQGTILALPAAAQLSRSFDRDRVGVQLNAPLVFGLDEQDFATVEVDRVALVFSREGMKGQVVLVMGESKSIALPFQVELNIDGSSVAPVDVELSYERTTGVVVVSGFGQRLRYTTDTTTEPVEVVVSAGAHDVMTLEALAVHLVTTNDATDDGAGQDNRTRNNAVDGTARSQTVAKRPSALPRQGHIAADALEHSKDTDPNDPPAGSNLRIFTPSAVRHGRGDALRAAASQALKSSKEAQP